MSISGHVQNGVIVLDGSVTLPEGAVVTVVYPAQATKPQGTQRPVIECEPGKLPLVRSAEKQQHVEFPLVPSTEPGSIRLTNDMIADFLDEEDASS